jgi:hypothetical protein
MAFNQPIDDILFWAQPDCLAWIVKMERGRNDEAMSGSSTNEASCAST